MPPTDAPHHGPPDASLAPRYTGIRTFARCPHRTDWENADAAVFGSLSIVDGGDVEITPGNAERSTAQIRTR